MATMGQRMRRLRERRALSQAELARRMSLPAAYISVLEVGRDYPDPSVTPRLAEHLGCSPEFLLTGRGFGRGTSG